jgi:hypothetical protein
MTSWKDRMVAFGSLRRRRRGCSIEPRKGANTAPVKSTESLQRPRSVDPFVAYPSSDSGWRVKSTAEDAGDHYRTQHRGWSVDWGPEFSDLDSATRRATELNLAWRKGSTKATSRPPVPPTKLPGSGDGGGSAWGLPPCNHKGPCKRCSGSGRVPFPHVSNGMCFCCSGSGAHPGG